MGLLATHEISRADLAPEVGYQPADFEWYDLEKAHLADDGAFLTTIYITSDDERTDKQRGWLLVAINGGSLHTIYFPEIILPRFGVAIDFAAHGNGLIAFWSGMAGEGAAFIDRIHGLWQQPKPLVQPTPLPVAITSKGFEKPIRPIGPGTAQGDWITFPVSAKCGDSDRSVESVAFMRVDWDTLSLKWHAWPEVAVPPKIGLLNRLLGKPAEPVSVPLDVGDFMRPQEGKLPRYATDHDRLPNVLAATSLGDEVIIATNGVTAVRKYGDRCAAVLALAKDGSVAREIFFEDFINRPDGNRKREYHINFTDQGRKAVIKSYYKTTDPWGGGVAILDIATGTVTPFKMPRGWTKTEVLGCAEGQVLMGAKDHDTGNLRFGVADTC